MEILLILLLTICVVAITRIDKSKLKEKLGEARISSLLKKRLDGSTYHLIDNVTIPGKGGTTQIDHVVVSAFGIFVIEVKNMTGWIFGSKKQKSWTQKIYKNTYRFQNPLHQNHQHVKTLSAVLALDETRIFSMVVFCGKSEFKTQLPDNMMESNRVVQHIHSHTGVLLSANEISIAIRKIQKARLQPSRATDNFHLTSLKSRHQDTAHHPD